MQRRINEFTLEPINNIMMGSTFGVSNVIPQPFAPMFAFLLMTGANFMLMNGQDLLLVKTT
jgi:hypothetical protein